MNDNEKNKLSIRERNRIAAESLKAKFFNYLNGLDELLTLEELSEELDIKFSQINRLIKNRDLLCYHFNDVMYFPKFQFKYKMTIDLFKIISVDKDVLSEYESNSFVSFMIRKVNYGGNNVFFYETVHRDHLDLIARSYFNRFEMGQ